MRFRFLILIFVLFCLSCKKDVDHNFVISINDVMPLEIIEFKENIFITLRYEHPDGYVGFSDPDRLSLEVKDSRLENPDWFHVQPLAPPNEQISISGTLNVSINSVFLLSSANQEIFTYTISIMDREGNWSNELISMPITIMR